MEAPLSIAYEAIQRASASRVVGKRPGVWEQVLESLEWCNGSFPTPPHTHMQTHEQTGLTNHESLCECNMHTINGRTL